MQAGATVRVDIVGVGLSNQGALGDDNAHAVIRTKYAGKVKASTPRINGKPDLSGMWFMADATTFDDDADAVLTPWAQTVVEARRKNLKDWLNARRGGCQGPTPLPCHST